MSYKVAFKYKEGAEFPGIVTWFVWGSQEAFETYWSGRSYKEKDFREILEQGISEERCLQLAKESWTGLSLGLLKSASL